MGDLDRTTGRFKAVSKLLNRPTVASERILRVQVVAERIESLDESKDLE